MRTGAKKRTPSKLPSLLGPVRWRSLLAPIDLTPSSDRVLGRLSRLPLADDAQVTLLHVVPGSLWARERRDATRDAKKALAEEVRHLRGALPETVGVTALVRVGAAAREIGACAKSAGAELVVMGRGGARALRDSFLGSTAERVVRGARLPVLVVRLPPRSAYSRPALALDLDDAAYDVVRSMLRVLPRVRLRVTVIHAYDIPYRGLVYPSFSDHEVGDAEGELKHEATRKLTRLLAQALAERKVPPDAAPIWKMHVRYGSPRAIVVKAVRKLEADLLVLGTHAYAGAAYVFLGTVAGELLREAKCDVLVVPPAPPRRSRLADGARRRSTT